MRSRGCQPVRRGRARICTCRDLVARGHATAHYSQSCRRRTDNARLVTSSVLLVALTQYGCSSFRVRGPTPDATPAAEKTITILPSSPAVRVSDAAQLTLRKGYGIVRLEPPIIWTSSDPEVLKVVSMGERAHIVGSRPGNARVSVNTANAYSAWVTVRVYPQASVSNREHS